MTRQELAEAGRRLACYRGDRPALELAGREVVIVDDGMATGYTVRAAVEAVRARGAARIVVAVPIGSAESVRLLAGQVDEVVCLHVSHRLRAVGQAYRDFGDTPDDDVVAALAPGR